jgi:hypothetical protein
MPENVEELMNIKIEIGLSYQISLKARRQSLPGSVVYKT